jgi:hypothetical protein
MAATVVEAAGDEAGRATVLNTGGRVKVHAGVPAKDDRG